ncbi:DUF4209 domain-containing protein [Vibrio splendidus]|uniref:DUF4209 domain-containing protein n=1 Tax=Vibrio splendidus TaxID=29497 RepID=UPI000D3DA89A|nr:DUF4209 domain-containing protein [Vibrio splendidus]PTP78633.1 hypothetical protein CWO06_05285 [Vibrio splendidus]
MLQPNIIKSIQDVFFKDEHSYHNEFLCSLKLNDLFEEHRDSLESVDSTALKNLVVLSNHKINLKEMPLKKVCVWNYNDIKMEELPYLEQVIEEVNYHWLSAKFYDYLWSTAPQKNLINAKKALAAYQDFPVENLIHDQSYWERAIALATWSGIDEAYIAIIDKLMRATTQDGLAYVVTRLLITQPRKVFSQFSLKLTKLVKQEIDTLISDQNYSIATSYWELLLRVANNNLPSTLNKNEIKHHYSETYYRWAIQERKRNSHHLTAEHFRSALSQIEGLDKKYKTKHNIDSLKHRIEKELVKSREDITKLFKAGGQTHSLDLTDMITLTKESMQDQPFEAILSIQGMNLRNIRALYFESKKDQGYFVRTFCGSVSFTDESGKLLGNYPSNSAEARYAQWIQSYQRGCNLIVAGSILPALHTLKKGSNIDKEYFSTIINSCLIVPESQRTLATNALWFGYCEDFSTSLMLICPLIESILRFTLQESGIPTVTINSACEGEKSISLLLKVSKKHRILDSLLKFEIEALFSDRHGFNFRNKVAHGIIDDQASQSYGAVYVWWWFLRAVTLYQVR